MDGTSRQTNQCNSNCVDMRYEHTLWIPELLTDCLTSPGTIFLKCNTAKKLTGLPHRRLCGKFTIDWAGR